MLGKYLLAALLLLASLPAARADSTVSAMTAASALTGPELFYCVQGAADRKCTATQLQTFIGTGSGTVTSVGLALPGGVFTVTGSPVTGSGTLTATPAGTSGGIPYFSSATSMASSLVLGANAIVVGGGAGVAPSSITTGAGVVTAIGNAVNTAGGLVTSAVTALASLATVGTITSGTWQGTVIGPTYGGTGVNNGSSTITLAGNLATSGANALTLTTTATTNATLPSGTTTLTQTVASGTANIPASAVASAACNALTTTTTGGTVGNVVNTDAVAVAFQGDPTANTGFVPATTGMLTVVYWTSNATPFVGFKVCNNSSASITPTSTTLTWRVTR